MNQNEVMKRKDMLLTGDKMHELSPESQRESAAKV